MAKTIHSNYTSANGQKRMMAKSVGMDSEHWIGRSITATVGDYGCDPVGDGTFRMVPSGDVVGYEEMCTRRKIKA